MAKKKIDKRLKTKFSIEDGCPSPDRSGNPFVFSSRKTKDWNG
jgi:hypothetical protein